MSLNIVAILLCSETVQVREEAQEENLKKK